MTERYNFLRIITKASTRASVRRLGLGIIQIMLLVGMSRLNLSHTYGYFTWTGWDYMQWSVGLLALLGAADSFLFGGRTVYNSPIWPWPLRMLDHSNYLITGDPTS